MTDDIWGALAAPIPSDKVQWRQQGRPKQRDGKWFAPFVAYIDAQFVRERLDAATPGEWDLTLELLPTAITGEGEEIEPFSFKARLQILGVIRESVGSGKDYKTAETDAFKRAAVRFGVAHELYTDYEIIWVQVDGDGKYAKPVEDPATVFARKGKTIDRPPHVTPSRVVNGRDTVKPIVEGGYGEPARSRGPAASGTDDIGATNKPSDVRACPKCQGPMWDNRLTKRNPKAPDFKCRDRSCDGVIWPERKSSQGEDLPEYQDSRDFEDSEVPF